MKFTSIKETCIYVNDLAVTRRFYHHQLGLPVISFAEGRHVFFRAGTSVLLCFIANTTLHESSLPPHGAAGIIHFALEVEQHDYDDAFKQVQSLGISIADQQTWKQGLRSFYFSDPDGHLVEIIEKGVWD